MEVQTINKWKIGASWVDMDGTICMFWINPIDKQKNVMLEVDKRNDYFMVTTGEIAKNGLDQYRVFGERKSFGSSREAKEYAERLMGIN